MAPRYASEQSPPKLTIGRRVGAECYVIRPLKTPNLLKPSNLSSGFVFPTVSINLCHLLYLTQYVDYYQRVGGGRYHGS